MPDLPLEFDAVPEGFCNSLNDSDWVQTLTNFLAQGVAKFDGSGFTVVLNQSTAPGPNDRDKLWRDPDTGLTYQWLSGAWITPHLYPPGGIAAMWVEATPAQIWAFDGGDGTDPAVNPPTTNNGAMWVIDTNYVGRSPMGAGIIPGSVPEKTLVIGENFGEGSHLQTEEELAAHTHDTEFKEREAEGNDNTGMMGFIGTDRTPVETTSTGESTPFNVVSPVRGNYRIVRSQRVNYVGA